MAILWNGDPVSAEDVLDGDELREHRIREAIGKLHLDLRPLRPFGAEDDAADIRRIVEREGGAVCRECGEAPASPAVTKRGEGLCDDCQFETTFGGE